MESTENAEALDYQALYQDVIKAESHKKIIPKTTIRQEVGQPHVITSSRFIDDQRKSDLKMPTRLCTFSNMYGDEAVYNSVDVTNLMVITSLHGGEFVPGPSNSLSAKTATEFLNYCIRNMSYGTWLEFLQDAATDLLYGWSTQNIVIEKRNYGPYKGSWCLRKLSPRDQKSVYGWLWNKDQTELLGMVQKPRLKGTRSFNSSIGYKDGLRALSVGKYYETDYPIIKTSQMLHFKYNSTNNNPQGDSPLAHCYTAWMEKRLIEEYQVVGVSKDLGGIVVLRVPSELIQKANDKTTYPEAYAEYQALQENTAALHAGKSSFLLLTSDSDQVTKKYHYDVNLMGVDGTGKMYNTEDIITQKKKAIYNTMGCSFLLLGEDSVGSYALSSDKSSTHSYYVERNLLQKMDVLNNQLAPRLLAANGIYLDYEDMPVYQAKPVGEQSKDEISKVIQRIGSVMKLTPKALEKMYTDLDLPIEGIEDLDFTSKGESRSGDGMATAGEGTSNSHGGKNGSDASVANNENTSVTKKLVYESETEDSITLVDTISGEPLVIDK